MPLLFFSHKKFKLNRNTLALFLFLFQTLSISCQKKSTQSNSPSTKSGSQSMNRSADAEKSQKENLMQFETSKPQRPLHDLSWAKIKSFSFEHSIPLYLCSEEQECAVKKQLFQFHYFTESRNISFEYNEDEKIKPHFPKNTQVKKVRTLPHDRLKELFNAAQICYPEQTADMPCKKVEGDRQKPEMHLYFKSGASLSLGYEETCGWVELCDHQIKHIKNVVLADIQPYIAKLNKEVSVEIIQIDYPLKPKRSSFLEYKQYQRIENLLLDISQPNDFILLHHPEKVLENGGFIAIWPPEDSFIKVFRSFTPTKDELVVIYDLQETSDNGYQSVFFGKIENKFSQLKVKKRDL